MGEAVVELTHPTFALYPEEQPWFSFADYGALLNVMRRFRPKSVLEFGPGSSTLALIEGGAVSIDTCEDDPDWAGVYQERLAQRFPDIVTLHTYAQAFPLTIPAIDGQRFDLAFIDGPRNTENRDVAIRYALAHCDRVVCHDALASPMVAALYRARFDGWRVSLTRYDRQPGEPHALATIERRHRAPDVVHQ